MNTHIHEAAHATVALALGRAVRYAAVFADGSGEVRFDGLRGAMQNSTDASIWIAGTVAEAIAGCSSESCCRDTRKFAKIVARLATTSEERATIDEGLRRATRKLLRENSARGEKDRQGARGRQCRLWSRTPPALQSMKIKRDDSHVAEKKMSSGPHHRVRRPTRRAPTGGWAVSWAALRSSGWIRR